MREFVREQDAILNIEVDLWTWLPSYKYLTLAHGDYASEFKFENFNLLNETTTFLNAILSGNIRPYTIFISDELNDNLSFYNYQFYCPCGEIHRASDEPHEDLADWKVEEIFEELEKLDKLVEKHNS